MDSVNNIRHLLSPAVIEKRVRDGTVFLPEKNNVVVGGISTFLISVGIWTLASFAGGKMKRAGEKNLFVEEPIRNLGVGIIFSSAITTYMLLADIVRNRKIDKLAKQTADSHVQRCEQEKLESSQVPQPPSHM
jgi:hypothetical protein